MYSNKLVQVRAIVFAPCPLNKVKQDPLPSIVKPNSTKLFISKASLLFHDFYLNFLYKCFLWINWNCVHQPQRSLKTCNLLGIIRTRKHRNLYDDCKFNSNTLIQIFSPHNGTLTENLCSLSFQFKMIEQDFSEGEIVLLENVKLTIEDCPNFTIHGFVHKRSRIKSLHKCPERCDLYGLFAYSFIQRTYSNSRLTSRYSIFGEVLFLFKDQSNLFIGLRCAKDTVVIVGVQTSLICLMKNVKLAARIVMYNLVHKSLPEEEAISDYVFDFDSKYAFKEIGRTPQKDCYFGGHRATGTTLWIFPDFSTRTELLVDKWSKIVDQTIKFYEQGLCS